MVDREQIVANRKRLVEALRSGEYEQGLGTLRSHTNEYCCLGVAGDILTKLDPEGFSWKQTYEESEYALMSNSDLGTAPYGCSSFLRLGGVYTPAAEQFGFSEEDESYLADLNDKGVSFNAIGDAIEGLAV